MIRLLFFNAIYNYLFFFGEVSKETPPFEISKRIMIEIKPHKILTNN